MNRSDISGTAEARARLIEVGGRTGQELGLGRIVGQILVYLYLTDGECSLDQIGSDLELSKASVSISARQLESMGLLRRSWKKGDRKSYYRTADTIESALQKGLLTFIRQKVQVAGEELNSVSVFLEDEVKKKKAAVETKFLCQRVQRAVSLRDKMVRILENPLLKLLS